MKLKKALRRGLLGLVVLGLGIQLIPGGRDHDNPPVSEEPEWDAPRTRDLAVAACRWFREDVWHREARGQS